MLLWPFAACLGAVFPGDMPCSSRGCRSGCQRRSTETKSPSAQPGSDSACTEDAIHDEERGVDGDGDGWEVGIVDVEKQARGQETGKTQKKRNIKGARAREREREREKEREARNDPAAPHGKQSEAVWRIVPLDLWDVSENGVGQGWRLGRFRMPDGPWCSHRWARRAGVFDVFGVHTIKL